MVFENPLQIVSHITEANQRSKVGTGHFVLDTDL